VSEQTCLYNSATRYTDTLLYTLTCKWEQHEPILQVGTHQTTVAIMGCGDIYNFIGTCHLLASQYIQAHTPFGAPIHL
jgi:hypothetical protein